VIAAVVIASGFSRRMGRSKLTLELGGRTFLQRALDAATGAHLIGRCLVTLRPEDASLFHGSTDAGVLPEVVLNPLAAEGQSASIRLAVERLDQDQTCEAVIFSVVDQPFMRAEVFDTLAQAWQAGRGEILVSAYAGQRGNPVLFARRFFAELRQLAGDVGGREVMRAHPEAVYELAMPDPQAGRDVDTWDDFLEAQRSLQASED
jgi:molybdenum cofactor cytidylyltransferase